HDLLRCGLSAMVRRKYPRHHDRELRSATDPAANPADLVGFPDLYGLHAAGLAEAGMSKLLELPLMDGNGRSPPGKSQEGSEQNRRGDQQANLHVLPRRDPVALVRQHL